MLCGIQQLYLRHGWVNSFRTDRFGHRTTHQQTGWALDPARLARRPKLADDSPGRRCSLDLALVEVLKLQLLRVACGHQKARVEATEGASMRLQISSMEAIYAAVRSSVCMRPLTGDASSMVRHSSETAHSLGGGLACTSGRGKFGGPVFPRLFFCCALFFWRPSVLAQERKKEATCTWRENRTLSPVLQHPKALKRVLLLHCQTVSPKRSVGVQHHKALEGVLGCKTATFLPPQVAKVAQFYPTPATHQNKTGTKKKRAPEETPPVLAGNAARMAWSDLRGCDL